MYKQLNPQKIIDSIEKLQKRIDERFPDSSLSKVCAELLAISYQSEERARSIDAPIIWVRISTISLTIIIIVGLILLLVTIGPTIGTVNLPDFIQLLEAGINDVVLIGAGIFFLISLETRIKRTRALSAIHELRSIAHIIDMHQLTKDPVLILQPGPTTPSSPTHSLTPYELSRYLDYCSEMLSLTGKIAALYIQTFEDGVAIAAVNEVESLTTSLSRKVWQKLIILQNISSDLK